MTTQNPSQSDGSAENVMRPLTGTDNVQAMTDAELRTTHGFLDSPTTSGVSIPYQRKLLAEVDRLRSEATGNLGTIDDMGREITSVRSRLAEADNAYRLRDDGVSVTCCGREGGHLIHREVHAPNCDAYLRQRTERE